MSNNTDIKDKIAIVTGGSQGIGREICRALAAMGANVAVADVQLEKAEETAASIQELGQESIAVKTDVSSESEVNELHKKVLDHFGTVDILVNAVGICEMLPKPSSSSLFKRW